MGRNLRRPRSVEAAVRTRLLLAAALLLVACGDDDDAAAPDDVPADASPGGAEGNLFVEIAFTGGLVPQEFAFRAVPQTVIYGDGTVVAAGATTLEFPGPAVTPLVRGTLDGDSLRELVEHAGRAGMIGGHPDVGDAGAIPVADAAATRVTVVVDGDKQLVEAYALDLGADVGPTNLTEAQRAARAELAAFVSAVNDAGFAATEPYEPERYRVMAFEPVAAGDDVAPNVLLWPGGVPEPVMGECVVVEGEAAATLAAALVDATQITRWTVGDTEVAVAVRPILDHEPGC
jgi:hypothetical protein